MLAKGIAEFSGIIRRSPNASQARRNCRKVGKIFTLVATHQNGDGQLSSHRSHVVGLQGLGLGGELEWRVSHLKGLLPRSVPRLWRYLIPLVWDLPPAYKYDPP